MLQLQQQEVSPSHQGGVPGRGGAGAQADLQAGVRHQVLVEYFLILLLKLVFRYEQQCRTAYKSVPRTSYETECRTEYTEECETPRSGYGA